MNKNRFFCNSLIEKDTAKLFLYGDVGDGERVDSYRVAQELATLERSAARIEVRINSNGGDVFSGIAIYNALRNSKADIRLYIDGVAASIAAVIALCGKPLYMAKYAKMMIHNVSGGTYGNAEELRRTADNIERLEDDLAQIIAERCSSTAEDVKTRYFDGNDHWFSASECKRLGLISGIYDLPETELKQLNSTSTEAEIYTTTNKARGFKPVSKTDLEAAINKGLIPREQRAVFEALAKSDRATFEEYINKKKALLGVEISQAVAKVFRNAQRDADKIKFYNDLGNEIGLEKLKQIFAEFRPAMRVDAFINGEPQPHWTLEDYRKFDPLYLLDNPDFHERLKQQYGGHTEERATLDYYRKHHPELLENNPSLYNELVKRTFND